MGDSEERVTAGAGDAPALGQPLSVLRPVPAEASQEIFRIASMAPGALLLEAQKEYEVRVGAPLQTAANVTLL